MKRMPIDWSGKLVIGHVLRSKETEAIIVAKDLYAEENKETGRLKKRLWEALEKNMEMAGVCEKVVRNLIRLKSRTSQLNIHSRKDERNENNLL